jgi:uncharacterized membrane protein
VAEVRRDGTSGRTAVVEAGAGSDADDSALADWGHRSSTLMGRAIAALVLSLAGWGIALYLTIEHFTGNSALSCPANAVVSCEAVTTSPESKLLGVSVALLGLIFFTAMVAVNLPIAWRTSLRWVAWLRLAMVVGGMGFVIYLVYAELFMIKKICLWCTGVHVATFLLFVLVVSSIPAFTARTD